MRLLQNSVIASCLVTAMAVPLPDGAGGSNQERQQHSNQQGQRSPQMQNQAGRSDVAGIGRAVLTHGLTAAGGAGLMAWISHFKKQAAANPHGTATSGEAGNQPHGETAAPRYTNEELADRASDAGILLCVADCISRRRYGLGLDSQSLLMRVDVYANLLFGRDCLEECVREADGEAGSSRLRQAPFVTDADDDEAQNYLGFSDAAPAKWGSDLKQWGNDAASRLGAGLLKATDAVGKTGAKGNVGAHLGVPAHRLPGIVVP